MDHIMCHNVWRFEVSFLRSYKLLRQLRVKRKSKKNQNTFEAECVLTEVEFLGLKVYPVDSALRFSSSRNEWLIFTRVCTVSSDSSYLLCNCVHARDEERMRRDRNRVNEWCN
jgi:hypothetical protein